jgi:hypothetical protein
VSGPIGSYRFLITANRYRLASRPFRLRPARDLLLAIDRSAGRATVELAYPPARPELDFTARPGRAPSGEAVLRVGGKRVHVPIPHGSGSVAASASTPVVEVEAHDAHGNSSRTDTD